MNDAGVAPARERDFADEAFAAAAGAYARDRDRWERAVHAAIDGLFRFLARRATETSACVLRDDPRALLHRDATIDRFTALLGAGRAVAEVPPPPVVSEAIGGGIYAIVRRHAAERRLAELPAAVPDATVVALTPFVGRERTLAVLGHKAV